MGMSSSQARLLSLTSRQHDIEYKAQRLEAQKLQMASDSDKVYSNYLLSLDATKLQYYQIASDGSKVAKDATLNALENGIIKQTSETSPEVLFLQSTDSSKIYLTPQVAQKYNLSTSSTVPSNLDDYIHDVTGKNKTPIYDTSATVQDPDNILSISPVANTNEAAPTNSTSYVPVENNVISNVTSYLNTTGNNIGIATAEDFENLMNNSSLWDKNFVLETDIDLSGINWTGIGNQTTAFTGNFNGNGHTVSNITMNTNSYGYGLFGFAEGGTISNIAITGANITSTAAYAGGNDSHVGVLVGKATGVTISNCSVKNSSVSGKSDVGLLVGHCAGNTSISNCYVQGTARASVADVGGITGELENSTITNCYSNATVSNTGTYYGYVGGIAGKITGTGTSAANISNCYAAGTVSSNVSSTTGVVCGAPNMANNTTTQSSVQSSWDSSLWTTGSTPTLKSQASEDYITVSTVLSGATSAVIAPSLKSISSNIMAALSKSGETSISSSTVDSWLSNKFGTNNDTNNKTLASYNYYLAEYLKSASADATFINALAADIKNSTTSSTSTYATKYNNVTGLAVQRGYSESLCKTNVSNTSGTVTIPSLTSIESNIYNALKKAGYTVTDTQIQSWVNAQYQTNNNDNNVILANINKLISDYANGTKDSSALSSLNSAITGGNRYVLTDYYDPTTYTATRGSDTSTCNVTYGTKPDPNPPITGYYWDTTDPDIKNAMIAFSIAQRGFEVVDENLASSNSYLTNMISSGKAVLTTFNPDNLAKVSASDLASMSESEYNELMGIVNKSVSSDTSIFEVANTNGIKKAEATYEANMKKINAKETRIDSELSKLESERTAIKEEEETVKTVIKNNVDLSFKLFS